MLDIWLALWLAALIVCAVLLLVIAVLVLIGINRIKAGSPPTPAWPSRTCSTTSPRSRQDSVMSDDKARARHGQEAPDPFRTPETVALEAELAVTRAQLASTVDELVARLDPRAQAGRAVESGRQLWSDATNGDADPADARKKAFTVLGGAAAGVAVLLALIIAAAAAAAASRPDTTAPSVAAQRRVGAAACRRRAVIACHADASGHSTAEGASRRVDGLGRAGRSFSRPTGAAAGFR